MHLIIFIILYPLEYTMILVLLKKMPHLANQRGSTEIVCERFMNLSNLLSSFISPQDLEDRIISLLKSELKKFKKLLSPDYSACSEKELEEQTCQNSIREGAMKITLCVLKDMNQSHLAHVLQTSKSSG